MIFEEEKKRPLTLELENAKEIIFTAVNKAKQQCGIPNFILEGIIAEVHAQVSSQAKIEMISDFNLYIEELKSDYDKKLDNKNLDDKFNSNINSNDNGSEINEH